MATNKEKAIAILLAKYDKKHLANLLKQKKVIDAIYDELAREAARIGVSCPFDDPDKPFYLDDYPATKKRIDDLMNDFTKNIETTIIKGSEAEWLLSASKNSAMVSFLTKSTGIPKEIIEQWKAPNLDALKAFQTRKSNGMDLSQRVWNLGQQTKSQLELSLDVGLGQGKSAAELSRDVRKFLKEPEKLFRRVRDKEGNLRLSKNAESYHPGQGVYRSSYKNALRMTATETNMAYRSADHEKWNELDFIIGIEIQLSNNHTLNGKPFTDICDDMIGKYPKDFKFTGWHPFCRCIATPILADWNEVLENMDNPDHQYEGEVTEMPEGFNEWMENNAERIENAKNVPYFVKDNIERIEKENGVIIDDKIKNIDYNLADPKDIKIKFDSFDITEDEYGFPKISEKETEEIISELYGKEFNIKPMTKGYSAYDRDEDKLYISDITFATSKGDFNPSAHLRTFLTKIKKGENDWNILHEYSVECTWHEYFHSLGKGWNKDAIRSESRISAMETINQFCARMSYKDVLAKFNVKPKFENEILNEGLGYKNGVKNLLSLFDKYDIKKEVAYNELLPILKNTEYEKIGYKLTSYLHGKNVENAAQIVYNLNKTPNMFKKIMDGQ